MLFRSWDSQTGLPRGADRFAHAGTLSFEMSVGRDRLIVNCGAAPAAEADWRDALRATAAHSTLVPADTNKIGPLKQDGFGYPESLQQLVEGIKGAGQGADTKIKFLRRIPLDPMTNSREWGLRSMQDDPKSNGWGGQNVFDVYTKSDQKAADGTPYAEW